jgi:hypothetical protein
MIAALIDGALAIGIVLNLFTAFKNDNFHSILGWIVAGLMLLKSVLMTSAYYQ